MHDAGAEQQPVIWRSRNSARIEGRLLQFVHDGSACGIDVGSATGLEHGAVFRKCLDVTDASEKLPRSLVDNAQIAVNADHDLFAGFGQHAAYTDWVVVIGGPECSAVRPVNDHMCARLDKPVAKIIDRAGRGQ